jgi:integrase
MDWRLEQYGDWLEAQPLAPNTRRVYETQAKLFFKFLQGCGCSQHLEAGELIKLVEDYRTFAKTELQLRPSSINVALAAIESFALSLGYPPVHFDREQRSKPTGKAPESKEQKRAFLDHAESYPFARDASLALLVATIGLSTRLCSSLDLEDVINKDGEVYLRTPTRHDPIQLPLSLSRRLREWIEHRNEMVQSDNVKALFVTRHGLRMSEDNINYTIRKIGALARIPLTARILRA